jgi:hypothetical protein
MVAERLPGGTGTDEFSLRAPRDALVVPRIFHCASEQPAAPPDHTGIGGCHPSGGDSAPTEIRQAARSDGLAFLRDRVVAQRQAILNLKSTTYSANASLAAATNQPLHR